MCAAGHGSLGFVKPQDLPDPLKLRRIRFPTINDWPSHALLRAGVIGSVGMAPQGISDGGGFHAELSREVHGGYDFSRHFVILCVYQNL